ncbi:MAG: glycosyltransferase, partial [Bacteroidales bacterium]|nr:glycosyltransferase [Bacteroidales bacterium]
MPLISVIIPVFNGESYLRSCLESVLSQTLADFEAIVVDDGSTDGSSRICDEFSARDDRIRVIHQFNQGVSAARNAGLELATGQYIFFIDGDDTIVPETLESLYDAASDGDYDIAASGYSLVKETGEAENHVVVSGSSSVFSGDSIIEWMLSDAD